ncbi:MAG TPA: hypothetical protein VJ276_09150 [Thermoanaerobaculia bacterium]|nr:hypothetical protein [Thermoanaerobaculia bacterium]
MAPHSVQSSRRVLTVAAIVATVLVVGFGMAYLNVDAKSRPTLSKLLEEMVKVTLTFALIALGGSVIKMSIDADLEARRVAREAAQENIERLRSEQQAAEAHRREVVGEVTAVFSEFYSIRKRYHSALSRTKSLYANDPTAMTALRRELLAKAIDLEGRYGAVKTKALISLGLHLGDFGYKDVTDLRSKIEAATDQGAAARMWFDYLGEAFDGWRHGIERDEKIGTVTAAWEGYEHILAQLMTPTRAAA